MKIGDYIRTEKGKIGKIIRYIDDPTDYYCNCYVTTLKDSFTDTYLTEYDNIKSSSNILDLVEVDDYVNGFKVLEILSHNPQLIFVTYKYNGHHYTKILDNEDIESIVTHEQFENIKYKVGE